VLTNNKLSTDPVTLEQL